MPWWVSFSEIACYLFYGFHFKKHVNQKIYNLRNVVTHWRHLDILTAMSVGTWNIQNRYSIVCCPLNLHSLDFFFTLNIFYNDFTSKHALHVTIPPEHFWYNVSCKHSHSGSFYTHRSVRRLSSTFIQRQMRNDASWCRTCCNETFQENCILHREKDFFTVLIFWRVTTLQKRKYELINARPINPPVASTWIVIAFRLPSRCTGDILEQRVTE